MDRHDAKAYIRPDHPKLLRLRDLVMELKDLDERWEEASLDEYRFGVARFVAQGEIALAELGVLTTEYMRQRRGDLGDD